MLVPTCFSCVCICICAAHVNQAYMYLHVNKVNKCCIYLRPPQHIPDDRLQLRLPRCLWFPLQRCPAFGVQTLSLSIYQRATGYQVTVERKIKHNINNVLSNLTIGKTIKYCKFSTELIICSTSLSWAYLQDRFIYMYKGGERG